MPTEEFHEQRVDAKETEHKLDAEATIKRNPHGDFKKVEASRPNWDTSRSGFQYTKTKDPEWQFGDGATDGGESLKKKHIAIDPYEEGRPVVSNYKLMISAIVPRPIGFLGTRSKDGMVVSLRGLCVRELMYGACRIFVKPEPLQLHTNV